MEDLLKRITIDPKVMVGKPVIKGTRIPLALILREVSNGMTPEEIIESYPRLTKEDIRAAAAYAALALEDEEIVIG